jgi:hypothetical protein
MPGMTMTTGVTGAGGTGAAGGGNTVRMQDAAAGWRRHRSGIGLAVCAACGFTLATAARADTTAAFADSPVEQSLADDACLQELRRCCACPAWTHYVVFDLLFLQRNNQAGGQPLAYDSDTALPVLTPQDLQPSVGTGFRTFYGQLVTDRFGWEIGYTGIYGMFGQATATGPSNLEVPPPLGLAVNNFNDADSIRATYLSNLQFAEFNVFCYDCCEECGPDWCRLTRCRRNCHCIDWLAGFIWAGLDEQAGLTALCCDPPEPASYVVRTSTNYFGPQIGMRGRRTWCRWAVEGWWKTALCGTSGYQAADPIAGTISKVERPALSARDSGLGFIGQLNGTLIYRLTDHWGLRAGYNLYWLTGATLAPAQWDFTTAAAAGTGINDNGGLFLHGANLGTEYRW